MCMFVSLGKGWGGRVHFRVPVHVCILVAYAASQTPRLNLIIFRGLLVGCKCLRLINRVFSLTLGVGGGGGGHLGEHFWGPRVIGWQFLELLGWHFAH